MTNPPWELVLDRGPQHYILGAPQEGDGAKPIIAVLGRSNGNALEDGAVMAASHLMFNVCRAVVLSGTAQPGVIFMAQEALDRIAANMKKEAV